MATIGGCGCRHSGRTAPHAVLSRRRWGRGGKKRSNNSAGAETVGTQPPAKQRVMEAQPVQPTPPAQPAASTQPASYSQVDAALAATQTMAAAKAAAKAHPGGKGGHREEATMTDREVSPTVAMSDGAREKKSGAKGRSEKEREIALRRLESR